MSEVVWVRPVQKHAAELYVRLARRDGLDVEQDILDIANAEPAGSATPSRVRVREPASAAQ